MESQILAAKTGTTKAPDENYRLSSGDTIGVDLFRRSDLKAVMQLPKVSVAADGKIVLPHIGGIEVADQTIEEASTTVRDAYSSHMIEPEVALTLVDARGRRFFVTGEVKTPGVYTAPHQADVIEAVLMAGGFTLDADEDSIVILRQGPNRRVHSDIEELMDNAEFIYNVKLQPMDIVYVPPSSVAKVERFTQHVSKVMQPFLDVGSVIILSSAID